MNACPGYNELPVMLLNVELSRCNATRSQFRIISIAPLCTAYSTNSMRLQGLAQDQDRAACPAQTQHYTNLLSHLKYTRRHHVRSHITITLHKFLFLVSLIGNLHCEALYLQRSGIVWYPE